MRRVIRWVVEEVQYAFIDLHDDRRLVIFGLEITPQERARKRCEEAFDWGVRLGADGAVDPKPDPKPARVLQLVR